MNLGSFGVGGTRSGSPVTSSRGSSPAPRLARRAVEDASLKNDKSFRRYATNIERVLSTWDIAPEEWADYIAFLSRLLKAIQSAGSDVPTLPHSDAVASKLAQCLNPSLPSGVHQKALDVYSYIFSTFGERHVAVRLHEYLPGLLPVLSFAALSVRPSLYNLLDSYIVPLPSDTLRPVLKSLLLSLLPALEDETAEDFDQALATIEKLERAFVNPETLEQENTDLPSYFWQSVFLSIITSPPRRQGALNYLIRRLPSFSQSQPVGASSKLGNGERYSHMLHSSAEAAISPEPGLLVRAFACGLSDSQMLIQRGFLDLLLTHLPLDSPVLQEQVGRKDFLLLVSSGIGVLLRRDMSLNRRVWQWLLGPDSKDEAAEPDPAIDATADAPPSRHLKYFQSYGLQILEECLLSSFSNESSRPSERAKPFRIGVSLMDRWEIGGNIISQIFLPAMRNAYSYSQNSSTSNTTELMRSASLFFDGVESRLIWSNLFQLFSKPDRSDFDVDNISLFLWIIDKFNVKEEEMLIIHAPLAALYLLNSLTYADEASSTAKWSERILDAIDTLLGIVPTRAFAGAKQDAASSPLPTLEEVHDALTSFYKDDFVSTSRNESPYSSANIAALVIDRSLRVFTESTERSAVDISKPATVLQSVFVKMPKGYVLPIANLLQRGEIYLREIDKVAIAFEPLSALTSLLSTVASLSHADGEAIHESLLTVESYLLPPLWHYVSPSKAKYNLEAVKSLWRLDSLLESDEAVKASINTLVSASLHDRSDQITHVDNVRTFLNLWNLSLASQPSSTKTSTKNAVSGAVRRVSSSVLPSDHEKASRRVEVLSGPLMLVLDVLYYPADAAFEDVKSWVNNSPYTGTVIGFLCEQIDSALRTFDPYNTATVTASTTRIRQQAERKLIYLLQHIETMFNNGNETFWHAFGATQWPNLAAEAEDSAPYVLAERCIQMLPGSKGYTSELQRLATSVFIHLLSAPIWLRLRIQPLEITRAILSKLLECIASPHAHLQCSVLRLATIALATRRIDIRMDDAHSVPHTSRRRSSLSSLRPTSPKETITPTPIPVALLVQVLRAGFSSSTCYPYLDSWLEFLIEACPALGDALTSSLIPLTETMCKPIQSVFNHLAEISTGSETNRLFAPEATIVRLLDCLNVILIGAHDSMLRDEVDGAAGQADTSSTVLGSVTPNMFKSQQGPPSKTAKANNRLTVILASKDVVRTCVRIWVWASYRVEGAEIDRRSAATTSHNALKLRNRTRHMLEEIFGLEPLESLEVVISVWTDATDAAEKDAVLSLLHVLRGLRPKTTIPAILDALCSRTNAGILVPSRQSTLTSELTAGDVVLFYSAYIGSLEDDAMDEIWSDCTAFLRDVLSNPLPYRQILPALLYVTLQLAQKLENTNYGEKKRMRRELGDSFQRLLAATFAALPSGSLDSSKDEQEHETEFVIGLRRMDLVVILHNVVAKLESILETADRVTTCINTISANLISPLIRSKSFPSRLNADILGLLNRMSRKSPGAKSWRKDVTDAFNDARFVMSPAKLVESQWFPVLAQWSLTDKERMNELLTRLGPPSSAGIMFGVGASAARLDADRKTQLNLRRISILLLAAPSDSYVEHLRTVEEKMAELFEASATSSPSSAVKAELLMLCRALLLTTTAIHFAPFWPILNQSLQSALQSLAPDGGEVVAQNNLSLLQACKLLDLLAALAPDEFQLHEWMYLTNTTDAVYHAPDWTPAALSDQLSEQVGHAHNEENMAPAPAREGPTVHGEGRLGPQLSKGAGFDTEDVKAMAQDVFVVAALKPFLSQLSMQTYESKYRMDSADVNLFRRALVEDLQDAGTVVS